MEEAINIPVGTKVKVVDAINGHEFEIGEIVKLHYKEGFFRNHKGIGWYLEPEEYEVIPSDDSSIVYTEEEVKKYCTQFFYYWYNSPGKNTEEGFNKWWEQNKKK